MNNFDIEAKIITYFEGALSSDEKATLLKEINNSDTTKELFETYQSMYQGLDATIIHQPSVHLKNNFYRHLESTEKIISLKSKRTSFSIRPYLKYAAIGLILITFGALIGINWSQNQQVSTINQEMIALRTEMKNLLKNESTSVRIRAINMSNTLIETDEGIVQVLIKTMDGDDSENVRLATIDALEKFAHHPIVRTTFLNTLDKENSDFIKIKIINILASIKEPSAVRYLEQIIEDKNASRYLKHEANLGKEAIINL